MPDSSSIKSVIASKEKAAYYCAQQEHCIFDVRKKLFQWGVETSYHDEIIEYLLEDNFINETRYANSFCIGKFHQNKWGRKKIS
ncbi:MAG: RecX family transcriptional regulator, partial [Bacteroidota bacterium]|nr:RecX family transcriptional regulator [Bacteroidota bacterium]